MIQIVERFPFAFCSGVDIIPYHHIHCSLFFSPTAMINSRSHYERTEFGLHNCKSRNPIRMQRFHVESFSQVYRYKADKDANVPFFTLQITAVPRPSRMAKNDNKIQFICYRYCNGADSYQTDHIYVRGLWSCTVYTTKCDWTTIWIYIRTIIHLLYKLFSWNFFSFKSECCAVIIPC